MSKAQHTPGPWKVEGRYRGQNPSETYIGSPTTYPIFTILCGTAERDANARLIAAAPDYFDGVERMLAFETSGGDGWWKAWEMVKAAHAKAKGGAA